MKLTFNRRLLINPQHGCPWADKMVLNPAIVKDPADEHTLHMLFRATGPSPDKQLPGKPLPYPIFLGYACSRDGGESWKADFSRPAFSPALEYSLDKLETMDIYGNRTPNYANGCIEDPRLFYFEEELYLSVACRAFPPGPYWEHDDPRQCMPDWVVSGRHDLGQAISDNSTVSLLYKVDLESIKSGSYDTAFSLIGPLHPPDVSDDRDAFLFPRRLKINGQDKIVCIHRPKHPWNYSEGKHLKSPSIFLALADSLPELRSMDIHRTALVLPVFPWEANRVGGSWPPLEISPGEWLLPYHGKQDDTVGYTQSFIILRETGMGFPEIVHRPSARLMYAAEAWELEGDFSIPCMFTCSGALMSDGRLLMGYGAADSRIGMAEARLPDIINYTRGFDANGSILEGSNIITF